MPVIEQIMVDDKTYDIRDAAAIHDYDLNKINPATIQYSSPNGNLIPYYATEIFHGKYPVVYTEDTKVTLHDNENYTTYKILLPHNTETSQQLRCSPITFAVAEDVYGIADTITAGESIESFYVLPTTRFVYIAINITAATPAYLFDWTVTEDADPSDSTVNIPWLGISNQIKAHTQQSLGNSELPISQRIVTEIINNYFKATSNLLDPNKIVEGYTCNPATGELSVNTAYNATGFIQVKSGETITLQSDGAIQNMRFVTAFDANMQILPSMGVSNNTTSYNIADACAYVRITYLNTYTKVAVVYGTEPIPFEEFTTYLASEHLNVPYIQQICKNTPVELSQCTFAEIENLFSTVTKSPGYIGNQGNIAPNDAYVTTDFIKVEPGQAYAFYTTANNNQFRFVAEYNQAKEFIQLLPINVSSLITTENTAYIRATVHAVGESTATIVRGAIPNPDATNDLKILSKYVALPQMPSAEEEKTIRAFLPDEIICVVGRTIEIYNSQVCPNAEKYHFRWDCSIGKALKRKFSVTGTSEQVGTEPLTLSIYNDDQVILYTKTLTLKIINDDIISPKTICPIGDSLTNAKYWLWEVSKLNGNLTYVGTRESRVYDKSTDPATSTLIRHEGRSGWTSTSYLEETEYTYENEGTHPFWDPVNAKFSWKYYRETTGLNPDAVQIFLGTNDLTQGQSPTQFANNIQTMVQAIRDYDTTIPIFIVLTICCGDQNGIGNQTTTDGFAAQKGKFKYNLDCSIIDGVQALYDTLKSETHLYFIPLTQCHDSEYNFGEVVVSVNPRAVQTEIFPIEAIHPQQQGYEQIADVMYSVYCHALA